MIWHDAVMEHYSEEAERHGLSGSSTMEDEVIRAKELEAITAAIEMASTEDSMPINVMDLGCGNGFAVSVLSERTDSISFTGIDASDAMIDLAKTRDLQNSTFQQGDARNLPDNFGNTFDLVYTERCLVNILDQTMQLEALDEIHRVLKPGGRYLMLEGFTDGLDVYNKARVELGMEAVDPAHHNRYFEKEEFLSHISGKYVVKNDPAVDAKMAERIPSNFLSSHYFVRNVLHPLVTKGEWIRNTEFVKFFSFFPPVGNYGPIQAFLLEKI